MFKAIMPIPSQSLALTSLQLFRSESTLDPSTAEGRVRSRVVHGGAGCFLSRKNRPSSRVSYMAKLKAAEQMSPFVQK
eukprot:3065055-Rhodomonas_salina.1